LSTFNVTNNIIYTITQQLYNFINTCINELASNYIVLYIAYYMHVCKGVVQTTLKFLYLSVKELFTVLTIN